MGSFKRTSLSEIIIISFLTVMSFLFLYPVWSTFILSVSDSMVLKNDSATWVPKGWTLDAYKFLLSDGMVFRYYFNTVLYAATGTLFMLVFTSMMAYALTFRNFSARKTIVILLTITLFFNGGLVPYYLLIVKLGLRDTLWVMTLPGAISAWNVILFRTFFSAIPAEMKESPMMDGAGQWSILFRIYVPVSKPLLATFTLFHVVMHWNDFLTAVLFLRDDSKYPIQMLLRRMLVMLDFRDIQNAQTRQFTEKLLQTNTRTIKSAAVIITIVPILCVYPFLQKYFAKGILVGSIKG